MKDTLVQVMGFTGDLFDLPVDSLNLNNLLDKKIRVRTLEYEKFLRDTKNIALNLEGDNIDIITFPIEDLEFKLYLMIEKLYKYPYHYLLRLVGGGHKDNYMNNMKAISNNFRKDFYKLVLDIKFKEDVTNNIRYSLYKTEDAPRGRKYTNISRVGDVNYLIALLEEAPSTMDRLNRGIAKGRRDISRANIKGRADIEIDVQKKKVELYPKILTEVQVYIIDELMFLYSQAMKVIMNLISLNNVKEGVEV